MKVYEALANALSEEGVENVFGLMGDGNLKFISCWSSDLGKGYFGTRHESAAIAMADGYARATGKVGVCTVTQGPGLTNALTALVTARKAHSPLLLMAGNVASFQQGWPQDIDQDGVFAAAQIPVVHISDPKTPYADITRALHLAIETSSPVGVDMAVDAQEQDWIAWDDAPHVLEARDTVLGGDLLAAVLKAAERLRGAKRPVIIGGRGAVQAGCSSQLASIASRVGALLATTLRGKGLFDRDPFAIGIAGGLGTNLAVKLIGEADVVLIVGAGMNDFTTLRNTLIAPSASVIRIDIDPDRVGSLPGGQFSLVGDASALSTALDAALAELGVSQEGYRGESLRAELEAFRPEHELVMAEDDRFLDPRAMTVALDRSLPSDRVVVTDAGHFFGNPCTYMGVRDARSFVCGIDFGSIGLGIGMAMGACVADPSRPTVLFAGDGGLLMSLGDLDTAVRYRLPVLVVVMNDAAYGSELQIMRLWKLPEHLATFPSTDFAALASAFGMPSFRATTLPELERALSEVRLDEGPALIDCAVSRDVRAAWLDEAFSR